jgi:hypothetical protein
MELRERHLLAFVVVKKYRNIENIKQIVCFILRFVGVVGFYPDKYTFMFPELQNSNSDHIIA